MKEFLVYLAGPIAGQSYTESVWWREYASSKFPPHIIGVSPMRGQKFRGAPVLRTDPYARALTSPKGITHRDRMDVMRADLVLMNLTGTTEISLGTVMEAAWADAFRKPLVIAMEESNPHRHPMLCEVAGFIVPTIDEAIAVAIAVLSPTVE